MSKETSSTGGIGFLGLLGILFIGLKLTSVINWSWWFVLMPIYLPLTIAIILLIIVTVLEEVMK